MKYGIYCMRDNVRGFLDPVLAESDALALRNYEFTMSRESTLYSFRPSDFSFYKLGEFDSETGKIDTIPMEVIA